jgi:hypothetical protein
MKKLHDVREFHGGGRWCSVKISSQHSKNAVARKNCGPIRSTSAGKNKRDRKLPENPIVVVTGDYTPASDVGFGETPYFDASIFKETLK